MSFDQFEEITKTAVKVAHETLPKVADAQEKDYGVVYSVSGPGAAQRHVTLLPRLTCLSSRRRRAHVWCGHV